MATLTKIAIASILVGLALLGFLRLPERIRVIQTPDGKHVHQVYGQHSLATEFIAQSRGLSALSLVIHTKDSALPEEPIVRLRNVSDKYDIPTTLVVSQHKIRIAFELQEQSYQKTFRIDIEAPGFKKENALFIPYESDSTKYPNVRVWQNGQEKQGSLGLTEYERPLIQTMLIRWLLHEDHRTAVLGIIMLIVSVSVWIWQKPFTNAAPSLWWRASWEAFSWKKAAPGIAIIFITSLIVYWPATKMFFIQDDIVKLARVKYLEHEPLKLLFTNHLYVSPGNEPQTPVVFYRPLSFSFVSLALWNVAGLNPVPYHISNIILLAVIGSSLFILGFLLFRKYSVSFLASLVWLFHSTKIELSYWWSQNEDLIANMFLVFGLIAYTKWRAAPGKKMLLYMFGSLAFALTSKEHAIFFPAMIVAIELASPSIYRQPLALLKKIQPALLGTLMLCGAYLIIRTLAIYDPSLPPATGPDTSYETGLHAPIAQNILQYAAWSAENLLWPSRNNNANPYYPGVLLISSYILALLLNWRHPNRRRILILAAAWWILMIGPQLLLVRAWNARWLSMSIWSLGIYIALVGTLLPIYNKRIRAIALAAASIAIISYGYYLTHNPAATEHLLNLSANTKIALDRFIQQENDILPTSVVHIIGIPPDTKGSINAQLLRLVSTKDFAYAVFEEKPPVDMPSHDIIIDMRDIYAPETL